MDLQNSSNCKLYKCRSLLACDTGGTVYDYYSNNMNNRNESQKQFIPSSTIVYFNKAENQQAGEALSPPDSTTHLDDDEFNDGIYYSSLESHGSQDVNDVIDEILNCGNYEHLDDSDNSYTEIYYNDLDKNDDYNYFNSEFNFQYSSPSSQLKSDINSNSQKMTEVETKTKVDSSTSHAKKRKQTYNIKMDSFTEVVEEDKITVPINKNRKRKTSNKENQNKKSDPFANLKMSSILKGNKKQIVENVNLDFRSQRVESSFTSSDESVGEESFRNRPYHTHFFSSLHGRSDILQEINTLVKLNAEFTNADYMEYVQPREKIVESNMDKLVSPTVEIELSEIMKTCELQKFVNENHSQLDCNGNEIISESLQKKDNAKLLLSPSEKAEKEFFRKSVYAKKFCFENYFNTSNDSLIDDILFNESLAYDELLLDCSFETDVNMHLKQYLLGKSFKSVSCTLLETLNEFNQFGGFIEENGEDVSSSSQIEEDSRNSSFDNKIVYFPESNGLQKSTLGFMLEQKNVYSDSNFNFLNKSSLLPVDFPPKYSIESPINNTVAEKQSSSLKIKIKRINDEDNKYVIDDAYVKNLKAGSKKTVPNQVKNQDRYECHDCFLKFRTKRLLKSHVSAYHKGPYDMKCEYCHMKFKKSSAHKKHEPWCQNSVTHKCGSCNKEYCYRAALLRHLKSHGKNVIHCPDV